MTTILKAENISKQYRLGNVGTGTIKDDLKRNWYALRGKEDPFLKIGALNDRATTASEDYVWALRNINFEVAQGEVLGIIGKNGAGKSTLLKILSRVTAPTTGVIKTKGRIASLLEVGTGFHPELTGMENIYLNGAILGMSKTEITSKIDEIVNFSGCERYIDTPTKRYSSGMTVRLAFAVAAHLEPDILVVDEVLAVGDAEFQKKAIGKMQEISHGQGRTVLFVSHNMGAVKSLCSRAILLENGQLTDEGTVDTVISNYLMENKIVSTFREFSSEKYKTRAFELSTISIYAKGKDIDNPIEETDEVVLQTEINILNNLNLSLTFHLLDDSGNTLFSFFDRDDNKYLQKGKNTVRCSFPKDFLQQGMYFLNLFIVEDRRRSIFKEEDVLNFSIINGSRAIGTYVGREPGLIKPTFLWDYQ